MEMAGHVVRCSEAGHVEAFTNGVTALEKWLDAAYTDPDLVEVIVEYVQGRDFITMSEIVSGASRRFQQLGHS